jgi:hypothetical protein
MQRTSGFVANYERDLLTRIDGIMESAFSVRQKGTQRVSWHRHSVLLR